MRRPKETTDLSQCVRFSDPFFYIFCVECDDWKRVEVICQATVVYKQTVVLERVYACHDLTYSCGQCGVNIEYLLNKNHKYNLIKRMDIPIKGE